MFYPTENYSEEYLNEIKKIEEKRKIKKAANLLGVAFLIMTSIMVFWSFPVSVLETLGVVDTRRFYEILSDNTVLQALQIGLSTVAFLLSYWLYAVMMKERLSDVCAFNKPKNEKLIFPLILLGLGVCGISNFLTTIAGGIFQSMGFEYNLNLPENPTNTMGVILTYIAVAVTPALVEEFAIRGVVLGVLRRFGDGFAVIVSAVIFGLMHGNFAQIPFAFVIGIYLGFLTIKTQSVWPGVILHFLNNFFSITLSYLTRDFSDILGGVVSFSYIMVLMLIGVLGFVILVKTGEKDFSFDKNTGILTTGQKIVAALTAPCMIISYVVVFLEAIFVYAKV